MKNDTTLRDAKSESRKGRKPKNGKAMTPAERKRLQRKLEKEKQTDAPTWLRYRREILSIVMNRYLFANSVEIAHALGAVSLGLTYLTTIRGHSEADRIDALQAITNPTESQLSKNTLLAEFAEFSINKQIEAANPGFHNTSLFDLYRDLFESHETQNGGDE